MKESDIEWLENMLGESKTRKIVALGEIGLDYYYVSDDADMAAAEKKQQREWFASTDECSVPYTHAGNDSFKRCMSGYNRHIKE